MQTFTLLSALLSLSASALAYTTPTTFNVTSNPIFTPSLGELVPVGKPFNVTWGKSEDGTVTILLLRGAAQTLTTLYPIAEKIKNVGYFEWTPKTDLENDVTHYGLQLIKDSDGQFQYSVQFGISNPNYKPSSSASGSATATGSATTSASKYSTSAETTSSYVTVSHTIHSSVTSLVTVTTPAPYVNSTSVKPISTIGPPPIYNTTAVASGTSTPTLSTSGLPTPSQTGAASGLKVASSLLVGVAAVAAAFL